MANLTSVNINGALIRKEGTIPADIQGATMFPTAHQVFTTADISFACAAVDPNNAGKIAVAFRDNDNGDRGKVRIGNVQTNNTIVWTEDSIFNDSDEAKFLSIDFDYSTSPIRIVVTYADFGNNEYATARVGTLDGSDQITWGTKKVLEPNQATTKTYVAFDPNNAGKFAVAHNAKMSVCTIDGSTITQGQWVNNGSGSSSKAGPVIWDPFDSTKFLTAYEDGSSELHARVCQVSGTTITHVSAPTTMDAGVGREVGLAADPNVANRFVVSYQRDTNKGSVRTIRVKGSAGSWVIVGSPYYDFDTNPVSRTNVFFTSAANRFIVIYRDNYGSTPSPGTAVEGTLSATASGGSSPNEYYTVTGWGSEVDFEPNSHGVGTARYAVHDQQLKKFIIAYDANNVDAVAKVGIAEHNKITVDLSTGNYFETDLEAATDVIDTFTITETLTGTQAQTFFLKVTQGSTARQIEWTSNSHIKWPGSSGPTLSTGNDAVDIFRFTTYDQGTTWHGETIGQNFS